MKKTVCGIETDYIDAGQGEMVFLLHGWGSSKELFQLITDTVKEKYRVIAPDFPGFGATGEPERVWSLDDFTGWTAEFIASFKPERVIILGHSFGGRVAIKLASADSLPFEISKLILVDSAGITPKRSLGYKIKVGTYKGAKAVLGLPFIKSLFPGALESYRQKRGSADYVAASEIMRGCLVRVVNEDLQHLMPKITRPVLLIWGENDDATPLSDGEKMEKLMPEAGLVRLKGAGHYSWLDCPGVFTAVIKSFLEIA